MATDWSQFKPVTPTPAAPARRRVDWSQFKPAAPSRPAPSGGVTGYLRQAERMLNPLAAPRDAIYSAFDQAQGGDQFARGAKKLYHDTRVLGADLIENGYAPSGVVALGRGMRKLAGVSDFDTMVRQQRADSMGQSQRIGAEIAANTAKQEDGSLPYYASQFAASAPLTAAALIPGVGLPAVAVGAGAGKYTDLRAEGKDFSTALGAGAGVGALEALTELPVIKLVKMPAGQVADMIRRRLSGPGGAQLAKLAQDPVVRTLLAGAAEAVGENVATLGEMGLIDEAFLGEDYTAGEYGTAMRDSAVLGAGMGAGLHAAATPLRAAAERREQEGRAEAVQRLRSQLAMVPDTKRRSVIVNSDLPADIKGELLADDLTTYNQQAETALAEAEVLERSQANAAEQARAEAAAARATQQTERLTELGARAPTTADYEQLDPETTEWSATVPARDDGEDDRSYGYRAVGAVAIPESLPEDHQRMFAMRKADAVVDVSRIRLAKEGRSSDNSSRFMALAREGKLPKRDPIDVRVEADGTYTVLDGNGTLAAAQKYGWSQIPVRIKEAPPGQEGWRIERGMLTDAKASDALTKRFEQAASTLPQFKSTLTEFGKSLGGEVLVGGLKGRTRAEEKVATDYDGDVTQLNDLLRGTVAFPDVQTARAALAKLQEQFKVTKLKDGLSDGTQPRFVNTGYRDLNAIVELPNGVRAEVQFNVAPLLEVKDGPGHKLYDQMRTIYATAMREKRALTEAEQARVEQLEGEQRALYESAWESALAGKPAASKAGSSASGGSREVEPLGLSGDSRLTGQQRPPSYPNMEPSGSSASKPTLSSAKNVVPSGSERGSVTADSLDVGVKSERNTPAPVGQSGQTEATQGESQDGPVQQDQENAQEGAQEGGEQGTGRQAAGRGQGQEEARPGVDDQAGARGRRGRDAEADPDGQQADPGQHGRAAPAEHGLASPPRSAGAVSAPGFVTEAVASIQKLVNPSHGLKFEVLSQDDPSIESMMWDENGNWDETTTAFYDPANNRVVVIAERQQSAQQSREDLTHEVTHAGLRAMLPEKDYRGTMLAIYEFARDNPDSIAGRFLREGQVGINYLDEQNITPDGEILFDTLDEEQMIELGDELVAHMSERYGDITKPREKALLSKVIEGVRNFMRRVLTGQKFSDDQIYGLITESRSYLRRKARRGIAAKGMRAKRRTIGAYEVDVSKSGRITVFAQKDELAPLLEQAGVKAKGIALKDGGIVFQPAAYAAVRNALEGNKNLVSRRGETFQHDKGKDGKIVGAPELFDTQEKLPKLRRELDKLVAEGEAGRFWYEKSGEAFLRYTGGDKKEATDLAKIMATFSPGSRVDANTTFGLIAWAQHKAGVPIRSGRFPERHSKAAQEALDGHEWNSTKTKNFFINLQRAIDPDSVTEQGVTVDMWVMRIMGFTVEKPTAAQYHFAEIEVNRIAKKLGWEPQQVQAAMWVAAKARWEPKAVTSVVDQQTLDAGDMVVKNDNREFASADAQRRHIARWRAQAMQYAPTEREREIAVADYSKFLDAATAQFSWEAVPSTQIAGFDWLHGNPEAKQELAAKMRAAIGDRILRSVGLLHGDVLIGHGGWLGAVSPSAQELVAVATVTPKVGTNARGEKKPGKREVSPQDREAMDAAAALYGLLLKQDGVAWHRPYYGESIKTSNGIQLDFGRALTELETKTLYDSVVKEALSRYGVSKDRAQELAPIPTPNGVRFLNFGTLPDNGKFHKLVEAAAQSALPDNMTFTPEVFRSDGNLVMNNWTENANGEEYRNQIGASRFADVLGRVERELAEAVGAVYDDVGKRHGAVRRKRRDGGRGRVSEGAARGGSEDARPSLSWNGRPIQDDSVSIDGYHYSQRSDLSELDGKKWGKGGAGAEKARLADARGKYAPIKKRTYLYPRKDGAPIPQRESMLGDHLYAVKLLNIYDIKADPRDLRGRVPDNFSDADYYNELERLVVAEGFDGYVFHLDGGNISGNVILLGHDEGVPVELVQAGDNQPKILRKRRAQTIEAYNSRIDELFAGSKPSRDAGVMIADGGDVLDVLGHGDLPIMLNESHGFGDGKYNHGLTKEQWKKLPEWIENPVAVFKRDDGHLTFIAPELDHGRAIVIGVVPEVVPPKTPKGKPAWHLAVTVYAKDHPLPLRRMIDVDRSLVYLDQKRSPAFARNSSLYLPGNVGALRGYKSKVATERDLGKLRAERGLDKDGLARAKKRTINTTAFNGYTLPTEQFDRAVAGVHGSAIKKYIEGINATGRKFRRVFQDDLYPLRTLEDHIKEVGNYDDKMMNVYQRAELYYGRVGDRIEKFKRALVKPFINELAKSGLPMSALELYLYAKFAPVRNRKIYEANAHKSNSHEYLDGKSGMTGADAKAILADFDAKGSTPKLEQLAQMIYAINAYRIDLSEAAGLLSKEQADDWRSEPTYVPLKGFADGRDVGFETGARSGKGFSISGSESMRAKGRDSRAADLIENVIAQAETTIIRAEKNAVAQAFVALVAANPNEELWKVERMKVAPIRDPETGEIVEYGNGDAVLNFIKPTDRSQDIFIAKVSGKDYAIRLRGEGGVMLAEAMKNLGAANLGKVLSAMRVANRWLSMVRTTLNPEFVVANFARDIQTAMTNLTAEQGGKMARETLKGIKPAMAAIWRWEREQPGRTDWDRYYGEMRAMGGKTDFAAQRSIEEIQDDLKNLIKAQRDDAGALFKTKEGGKRLLEVIEALNSAVENSSRLAAYVAARKSGIEPKDAASIAKNLTVNFNRRGSAGPALNALYLFANASIQGTARFAQFVAHSPKKAMIGFMLPTFAMGFALSMINAALGGEDDDGEDRWSKVQGWERDRNMVLMVGETKFKIPLPYVYSLPYVMGSRMADVLRGDAKVSTGIVAIATNLINSFNPIGDMGSLANAFAPTLLDPAIDLERNRNFFDSPIRPENTFEPFPLPDSQKAWDTTPYPYKGLAEGLNLLTGGSETRSGAVDVSPTTFQYWVDFWLGGTGSFVERGYNLIEKGIDPHRDIKPQDVPFLRAVVAGTAEKQVSADYYKFAEDAEARKEQMELDAEQGLVDAATGTERVAYGLTGALASSLKSSNSQLRRLRKQRKLAKAQGQADEVRAIEEEMKKAQAEFNKSYIEIMQQLDVPVR